MWVRSPSLYCLGDCGAFFQFVRAAYVLVVQKFTSVHTRFFLIKATLFAFPFSSQLQRRLHVDGGRRRWGLLYRALLNSQFGRRREAAAGLIIIIWPILSIAYTPSLSLSLSPCDGRHIMNSFQFMNYVQTDSMKNPAAPVRVCLICKYRVWWRLRGSSQSLMKLCDCLQEPLILHSRAVCFSREQECSEQTDSFFTYASFVVNALLEHIFVRLFRHQDSWHAPFWYTFCCCCCCCCSCCCCRRLMTWQNRKLWWYCLLLSKTLQEGFLPFRGGCTYFSTCW